jgi:hypothetical protein
MEARSYTLKTMVLVRMFAEVSVFCFLVGLPIVLFFSGEFGKLPVLIRSLLVVAGGISLLILPVYGFIPFRVAVDVDGLRTIALFKQHHLRWDRITGLRLRTAFGWRRYVVIGEEDSISFPIWLNKVEELVDQIRAVLPQGGRMIAVAGTKTFAQDAVGTAFTIFKLSAGLIFVAIFWMFFVYLQGHKSVSGKPADPSDAMVILAACVLFTVAMLYRSYIILMMPRVVSSDSDGLTLQSWFKREIVPWADITGLAPPFFILPEGIVVKTKKAKHLIGNELDAFDELQDELAERVPVAKT